MKILLAALCGIALCGYTEDQSTVHDSKWVDEQFNKYLPKGTEPQFELHKIQWFSSFAEAKAQAKKESRPIFVMNVTSSPDLFGGRI